MRIGVAIATAHLLLALTAPTALAAGSPKPKPPSIKIKTNGEKTFLEVSGANVAEVVKAFRQLQAALAEEKTRADPGSNPELAPGSIQGQALEQETGAGVSHRGASDEHRQAPHGHRKDREGDSRGGSQALCLFCSPEGRAAPVALDGKTYPTVEHAFQAAKTLDPKEREAIRQASTPGPAKRLGRKATLRPDWDAIKVDVMLDLLRQKFSDPTLR